MASPVRDVWLKRPNLLRGVMAEMEVMLKLDVVADA